MTPRENRFRIAQDYYLSDAKHEQWWMVSELYTCNHPAERKKFYNTSRGRQAVCLDCNLEQKRKSRGMEPAYV